MGCKLGKDVGRHNLVYCPCCKITAEDEGRKLQGDGRQTADSGTAMPSKELICQRPDWYLVRPPTLLPTGPAADPTYREVYFLTSIHSSKEKS